MKIKNSIAYQYALWCTLPDNDYVGKYVKKQAKAWIDIVDGKDEDACADDESYTQVMRLLELMTHPVLLKPISETLEPYAHLLITALLCTKVRGDEKKTRYYVTGVLEIARKNFKTFNCAVIFLLLLLTEPMLSRFFSVAPNLRLSSELKKAINSIIKHSPALKKHFKVLRSQGVICKLNDSEYTPLAYSNDCMDGVLANAFVADEAGALDDYPVEAMRSSQLTLFNKLGIIISTQYPNDDNVMITEIDIVKKTLDGLIENKRCFGLLYEPDDELKKDENWKSDDRVLYQANPVAVSYDYIMDTLKEMRMKAILYRSKRENFLCKHCNIQYRSLGIETFIDIMKVRRCKRKIEKTFWAGKRVFLGVDLSETNDNTSVAMTCCEDGMIFTKVWGFIPFERIEEKSDAEHFDYQAAIDRGECFACGDETISYEEVENFIFSLSEEYGVEIVQIGFDKWNAARTIQMCEKQGYECVVIRQHSDTLHPATKLLQESILNQVYVYDENKLLENNFENARCVKDNNMNMYVNKKKSTGKVDMVVSDINSIYLLEQDELYDKDFDVIVG